MATALITGGHSGIGLEASKRLAEQGYDLVLAGRSPDRMTQTASDLQTAHGVKVSTLDLDTSSMASVRAAAATCVRLVERGTVDRLDAVLCNAGGRFDGPERYSAEGYEVTFATNCLGHFLLVELLLPLMNDDGRVVYTVSGTHNPDTWEGKMVGAAALPDAVALANDGKNGAKPLSAGKRYSTSKLCDVMYVYELARRLSRSGSAITAVAFDPGSNPSTGFLRGMPGPVRWVSNSAFTAWMFRRLNIPTSTPEVSGACLAAVSTGSEYHNGAYYEVRNGKTAAVRSSKISYDPKLMRDLWTDSERLVQLAPQEQPTALA